MGRYENRFRHCFALLTAALGLAVGCGGGGGDDDDDGPVTTEHCAYAPMAATAGAGGTVEAGALMAGAAERPLRAPVGTALGSYTARAGFLGSAGTVDLREVAISGAFNPSIGVESMPRVRAVALAAGGETVVLLEADFGFAFEGMIFDLEARLGSDFDGKVLLAASHSHSGWGQYTGHSGLQVGAGQLRDIVYDIFLDTFEDAARAALDELRPAKIGFFAQLDFDPDNQITRDRRGENDELPFGGAKDGAFHLIRIDGTDDAPIAMIPIFGVHGTLMGETNSFASVDAPGGIERILEEQFDEEIVVMHLQGAGGDVSPTPRGGLDCNVQPGNEDDPCFDWCKIEGNSRVALSTMMDAYDAAGTAMQTELAIEMVSRSVELGPNPETFAIRDGALAYAPFERDRVADGEVFDGEGQLISPIDEFNAPVGAALCEEDNAIFPAGEIPGTMGIVPYGGCVRVDTAGEILGQLLSLEFESDATHPVCQTTRTTLSALRLGDYLIGTLPGEPTAPIAALMRSLSPVAPENTILVGYAQGHVGYILTPEDWVQGGYEPSITFWGPLEGEYLVERLGELMPLAVSAEREDAAAGGADRFVTPTVTDDMPIDDPAPMAGTIPAEVPERVWVRSGTPASAQPSANVRRVDGVATFVWIGEDPLVATPVVTLEREVSQDVFEPVQRRSGRLVQDRALLLEYTPLPVRREGDQPQTHYWAVEWQPVPHLGAVDDTGASLDGMDARAGMPLGRYRFHVAGRDYELTSDPFEVQPAVLGVSAELSGTTVTASVTLHAPKGYRLLELQGDSNVPVPVRGGTFTVELILGAGGTTTISEVPIAADGTLTVDAGGDAADTVSVRVIDAFGNTGQDGV